MTLQYTDTLLLPATDSYYFWERRWLNQPDTLPRYLRAAKWQMEDAKKRIRSTIEWRRDYKPDLIPPEEVRIESKTGKLYAFFVLISPFCSITNWSVSSTASTMKADRYCTCVPGVKTRK